MHFLGSLLSRFSGIVNCRLVSFSLCLKATYEWIHKIIVFLCLGYLTQWCFLDLFICLQISSYYYFFCSVVLHCVNVPHFTYPFFIQGNIRLFPGSGCDKQYCYEHSWACVIGAQLSILWVYTQRYYCWVLKKVVS